VAAGRAGDGVSYAFSVVIPSYQRRDVLSEVLAALDAQRVAPPFEIVVVDDGSRDGTAEWLREMRTDRPFRLLEQPNRGPAAARNRGVAAATGERVAFLGDDTVPEPGWIAAHDAAARRRGGAGLAVVGRIDWHPRMRSTPFLRHINEHGLQFGFALIDDPENVPFNFFYTSNLSLSRADLLAEPFDERFPYPAWEDIEAAYRLTRRRGLRLVYEPAARVLHDHPTDFRRFAARQEKAGYCAVVMSRLHPELGPWVGLPPTGPPELPGRAAQLAREGVVRALQFLPVRLTGIWEEALRYHYIVGLKRGWSAGSGTTEGAES
jgi:glycosyltransferase involved in cell wall biosynthesis